MEKEPQKPRIWKLPPSNKGIPMPSNLGFPTPLIIPMRAYIPPGSKPIHCSKCGNTIGGDQEQFWRLGLRPMKCNCGALNYNPEFPLLKEFMEGGSVKT